MATPTRIAKLRSPEQPELSRAQDAIARTVDPMARALGATPLMGAAPPAWIRPTILNGLSDYGGTVLGSGKVCLTSFHKDALGYVHTKLALTSAAGVASNTVAFVYPVGYRPSDVLIFNASSGATVWTLQVEPNGTLRVSTVAAGAAFGGYFHFLAER